MQVITLTLVALFATMFADHGSNAQGILSYTTAQGIFSYNVTDYWKVAATAVHCGTAGNATEKGEGVRRALETLFPSKRWIILIQDTDDLPWSGRSLGWNRMIQNNLCGYNLVVYENDRKECYDNLSTNQLLVSSVQNSYSLDNIEERILEKDITFNLDTDLVVTFRNGDAFISENGCIKYVKVDNIHIIYSGSPQFYQINVG